MSQKSRGETNLAFQGWAKMVSWLQSDWIPHGVSLQKHPQTPWHYKISPISIETPLQKPKDKKDINRYQQTLTDVFNRSKTTLRHSYRARLEPILYFGKTVKRKTFFHLTLLRHQNIKTSLSTTSKNDWVLPFFLFFMSVREKLQFTVFLDHPVSKNGNIIP